MRRTELLQEVRKMRFEEACPGSYPSAIRQAWSGAGFLQCLDGGVSVGACPRVSVAGARRSWRGSVCPGGVGGEAGGIARPVSPRP